MAIKIKSNLPNAPDFVVGKTNYAKHLQTKQVAGSVSVEKLMASTTGTSIQSTTAVPVHKAVSDGGCRVGCSGARTVNLGNYESVKISVWLEMPCAKEDIATTYDYVSEWVGEQLLAAVKQTKE